ncbi:hypothetical protein [Fundicoccus culcitae]|uniref:Uncharacterized protein n=1 Tax=Fundicoccus culcitae TaxID=2969821 RepID=A0ABY5P4F5_9LACT|nr:hypothetical protein [Fundicoccus culcitae]UUX33591.1 hypothetical protein NRE15_11890 [Fundicoccus culcitae]
MQVNYLHLTPSFSDNKCWVAEITDRDPTFKLKRAFQPETTPGVWAMYDGWYQIHGDVVGITPFQKEYVRISGGKMTRRVPYQDVLEAVDAIIAYEPERIERLRHQITLVLDEIIAAAPFDRVLLDMSHQKDELSMVDSSEELLNGLRTILKRKDAIIQRYKDLFEGLQYDF